MRQPNFKPKTIWTGDNLEIMRGMNSDCIDLIYLDPPFNSKADYAAPIGSIAAGAAFKDTWSLSDVDVEWINLIEEKYPTLYHVLLATTTNSDKSYLVYMAPRLLEMKRILKPNGSIYLHCDTTMSHYLKLVMDAIFKNSFWRNEIVWRRSASKNDGVLQQFGKMSDRILFYSGTSINADDVMVDLDEDYINNSYRNTDDQGRWSSVTLTGPKTSEGESGETWKGMTLFCPVSVTSSRT